MISSDTTYDERIAVQARGADLLLHEVAAIEPALLQAYPRFKEITAHHTSPEEAGRIFSLARPKMAVFTHIIALKAEAASSRDSVARVATFPIIDFRSSIAPLPRQLLLAPVTCAKAA